MRASRLNVKSQPWLPIGKWWPVYRKLIPGTIQILDFGKGVMENITNSPLPCLGQFFLSQVSRLPPVFFDALNLIGHVVFNSLGEGSLIIALLAPEGE